MSNPRTYFQNFIFYIFCLINIFMLMKKILLLLVMFISCTITIGAQELKTITGSSSVKAGSKESYILYFESALSVSTKITIIASDGKIDSQSNSNKVEKLVYHGSSSIPFDVYWNDVAESAAFIVAYKTEGNGKTITKEKIKITKGSDPGQSNSGESSFIFSTKHIFTEEDFTLEFNLSGSRAVEWDVNSDIFEKIEHKAHQVKTLRAKKLDKITKTTIGVRAVSEENSSNEKYDWHYIIVTIYPLPELVIENGKSLLCKGETITYRVNNLYPLLPPNCSYTNEWVYSSNLKCTYSSNDFAEFVSIKDGEGTVEAIITITEKNSSYSKTLNLISKSWVGAPKAPSIKDSREVELGMSPFLIVFRPNNEYEMYATSYPETTYTWEGVHNASIIGNPSGAYARIKTASIPINTTAPFMINVSATNRCGTAPIEAPKLYTIDNTNSLPGDKPTLKSTVNESAPVSVKVYSFTTGKLVYKKDNEINFDINNTTLKKGIYIINITDQEGNTIQEKIMKTSE